MNESKFVVSCLADGLLTLTLRRSPVNVLNVALLHELASLLDEAAQDASVRVLLLTGAGEKFFSAGVDVAEQFVDQLVVGHPCRIALAESCQRVVVREGAIQ